ncbi:MAG TPA: aminotransferase class V-fold PLP-dependent enzyme [Candidatus Paceibacterota bacterium]|nr:aminotransferase class V-fold PLP-dependent enzyme [Candidatus Paceibacterota bacterium]
MGRSYLDHAASTPVLPAARRAFLRALRVPGNPSSPHTEGREAKELLEGARRAIAKLAGMKREQVVFTGSATEANNLAIAGHVAASLRKHVLYMDGAHASIVETAQSLAGEAIPLKEGALDMVALRRMIRPDTTLVSVEAVSSETGLRVDTRAVREVLDEVHAAGGPRIYLHVDASQLPLIESFERTRLGADLITLDAQKVGGVRGIGTLLITPLVPLASVIQGGGQERGLRSGTPSPALAAAFAAALEQGAPRRSGFQKRAEKLRALVCEEIKKIPNCILNEGRDQAAHIINFSLIGRDTDYLATLLDADGIAVSTKSACETDAEAGSRAVFALTGDAVRTQSTIRVSFGPTTAEGEVRRFLKALQARVAFLDHASL